MVNLITPIRVSFFLVIIIQSLLLMYPRDVQGRKENLVYFPDTPYELNVYKIYGKKPGKSFHFVLNDIIAKDNRIPPKGFKNSAFKEHLSEPVGAVYADGRYWDDVSLEPPSGCRKIVVKLMYQSASWEYIKFLAEENRTDDWGKRLYGAWKQTGQCAPVVIAETDMNLAG